MGEHEQTLAHLKSAPNLLSRQITRTTKLCSRYRSVSPLPDLEEEVFEDFMCLDNTIMSRLNGEPMSQPKMRRLKISYGDNDVLREVSKM